MKRMLLLVLAGLLTLSIAPTVNAQKGPVRPLCPEQGCHTGCQPLYFALDTADYFVPNYPGWETAKRLWTGSAGGSNGSRWFSYAPGRYEYLKYDDGTSGDETYTVDSDFIYITSEQHTGDPDPSRDTRVWFNSGYQWLPRVIICTPYLYFASGQGVGYYNPQCAYTGFEPPSVNDYRTSVVRNTIDYGYNVGQLDSIIRIDYFWGGYQEWYYYGYHRGLLRWEHYGPYGVLLNWSAQTGEIPDSPISNHECF